MTTKRTLRVLLMEPRARHRKALVDTWTAAWNTNQETAAPALHIEASGSTHSLQQHLQQETWEGIVFPLLDHHASIEGAWRTLESAGYEIGYLFHVRTGHRPGSHERVPYVCKTRFGNHQHILILLGLMDMSVLEVRPPDETPHERYRKILNRIEEGFWDVGPDLTVAYTNRAFKNMVGDKAADGQNLLEFFDEADRARLNSILSEQKEGIIIPFMMRLKARDAGQSTVVQIDPSPRFGWGGEYLGGSALVREVTDSAVSSEESLRKERELYTLYAVASTLSRTYGLEDLVRAATEMVREQMAVDATSTWLIGEDGVPRALEPVGVGNLPLDPHVLHLARRWCEELPAGKPAVVIRDTAKARNPISRSVAEAGYRSMAGIPLQSGPKPLGYLWLACHDASVMNREWVSLLISIGHQFALAIGNALHAASRLHEEARRKEFYREAVFAITNGKLSLLDREDVAPVLVGTVLGEVPIVGPEDVRACREAAEAHFAANGYTGERCFDIAMCVSEGATNVLLHGGGGRMTVFAPPDAEQTQTGYDRLRIMLQDGGPGINFSELPRAVLKRGYSTAVSMGLGFTMILEMMDAVFLCSDERGTTLVMEAAANPVNAELEAWLAKVQD
ncbi:MAG: PAS domain S-box protein [Armatimonadetes bacterium]|nr:PAS domain S-box protein [Armatimonadota bacterium]